MTGLGTVMLASVGSVALIVVLCIAAAVVLIARFIHIGRK